MVKKTIAAFLPLILIILIFKNWFLSSFLSAHDWPYFFKETLTNFSLFPPAWDPTAGIGLGGEVVNYSLDSYVYFIVWFFVNTLGLPWEFVYKVFIFGLFLVLSVFSSSYLLKKIFNYPSSFQVLLSTVLYTANTYILMVLGGGQMGVALAYSVAPLVLGRFIKLTHNSERITQNSIIAGLVLAVQVMFDLRIAFLTMGTVLLYTTYHYLFIERFNLKLYAGRLSLVALIVMGLHAYWLLPTVVFRSHPAAELLSNFSSVEGFRFLSFATFSQTISLLHPNWPENIFGKTYFMRPEFLVLAILTFSSLLFINSKSNRPISQYPNVLISFFIPLGLLGAFLAKGANPPFGEINVWIFTHMPLSSLFRDSTKFYLLTALSYSVLIPFSVNAISNYLISNIKYQISNIQIKYKQSLITRKLTIKIFNISYVFLLFTIYYLLFLIRPVFLDQLSGTFKQHELPKDYEKLKDFLVEQTNFSRTLWIPKQDRYGFYSNTHPAVPADRLLSATNAAETVKKLYEKKTHELVSNLSVQYVVVPYDSFGEIFVKDREYNEEERLETIKILDNMKWLRRNRDFNKLTIYEIQSYKDHFWLKGEGDLSYKIISPVEYKVEVFIQRPTVLVFGESYSPYWVSTIDNQTLPSIKTEYNTNSFVLEKGGKHAFKVYFSKQEYYVYGRIITAITVLTVLFFIYKMRKSL